MPGSLPAAPLGRAVLAGLAAGAAAGLVIMLGMTELYIDWGSLIGLMIAVPLLGAAAGLLAGVTLALLRRLRWRLVPAVVLVAVMVAEGSYALSLETPLAAWNASRHWRGLEQRARAEREAAQAEVCRRLAVRPPIPPPLAPGETGGVAPRGGCVRPARLGIGAGWR